MALIDNEKDARRLARAIASELSLYNEEKVLAGIEQDNLFLVMADEIEEGRVHYKSRVCVAFQEGNFYERALVDVLVRLNAHVPSKLW